MTTIAIRQVRVVYRGRPAHAAAFPHLGRNALDAAVLAYQNVAALRQHITPGERIHGIFTDGGDKPNIVPGRAAQHWYIRSPSLTSLEPLTERVVACLEAGAHAAGCELELEWIEPVYADLIANRVLLDAFVANAGALGRQMLDPRDTEAVIGSTDMGNVSHRVPSIHPMLAVSTPEISIHSPEFTAFAGSEAGDRAVLDGAKSMAMTIADLWLEPDLLTRARSELDQQNQQAP
jgi:metal-dependent amidase/aminoacylase/carboxypeptidase family protein